MPEETSRPSLGRQAPEEDCGRDAASMRQSSSPYDWERDGEIEAPDAPVGLLTATIDAEWTGRSWRLSVDGIDDDTLAALVGGAASQALIERRDGLGQKQGGNAGEAEEPGVVNPEPGPTSWERHGDYDG